jgi:hypothetical protein
MAEQFLRDRRIWVGVVAQGEHLFLTEETIAAGDRKGSHYAVAGAQVFDFAADFNDFAHELVAEDIALFHRRNVAVVQM